MKWEFDFKCLPATAIHRKTHGAGFGVGLEGEGE